MPSFHDRRSREALRLRALVKHLNYNNVFFYQWFVGSKFPGIFSHCQQLHETWPLLCPIQPITAAVNEYGQYYCHLLSTVLYQVQLVSLFCELVDLLWVFYRMLKCDVITKCLFLECFNFGSDKAFWWIGNYWQFSSFSTKIVNIGLFCNIISVHIVKISKLAKLIVVTSSLCTLLQ